MKQDMQSTAWCTVSVHLLLNITIVDIVTHNHFGFGVGFQVVKSTVFLT